MNLYHIQFDGQSFYVEAESFERAIAAWHQHVQIAWGTDYDGTEQPESVHLVHGEPVIRARGLSPAAEACRTVGEER